MVKKHRMYVVKKYIKALSAEDAIRQDRSHKVDDCYIDDNWKEWALADALGMPNPYEEEKGDEN